MSNPNESEQDAPPPLKTDPRYGHFPWWPEDGDDWIHPEDVALARRTIPGPRIWRRDGRQGDFVILSYGDDRLRVLRRLWQETAAPAYAIGDWVEVRPQGMQHDPHTGRVRQVLWDDASQTIRFQIEVVDRPIENNYTADDLKPVDPTVQQPDIRIEPPPHDDLVDEITDGLPVDEQRKGPGTLGPS